MFTGALYGPNENIKQDQPYSSLVNETNWLLFKEDPGFRTFFIVMGSFITTLAIAFLLVSTILIVRYTKYHAFSAGLLVMIPMSLTMLSHAGVSFVPEEIGGIGCLLVSCHSWVNSLILLFSTRFYRKHLIDGLLKAPLQGLFKRKNAMWTPNILHLQVPPSSARERPTSR
ncbi:unnamed protein product, partial [Mesorhabditis belari]|uniref:Uncharacterized protein n=1 Tax=Mesorhabditis belari TaxID=2138241 RepID=A0AAF3FB60_9BILA